MTVPLDSMDRRQEIAAPVTVLLANALPLFRDALREAIDREPGFTIVAEAGDGRTAVALAKRFIPDVAILSEELLRGSGVWTCAAIRETNLPTKVLVIGEVPDQATLLAAVEAGAEGYLTNDAGVDDVVAAVRQLVEGHACVPPQMLSVLLHDLIRRRREQNATVERFARLSRRELEVLNLLSDGLDHREIAALLFVSANTVRTHIQNLLEKLEVHSRVEAVGLALEHDVIARSVEDSRPDRPC